MPLTLLLVLRVLRALCLLRGQAVAVSVQQVSMHLTRPLALFALQGLCVSRGQPLAPSV